MAAYYGCSHGRRILFSRLFTCLSQGLPFGLRLIQPFLMNKKNRWNFKTVHVWPVMHLSGVDKAEITRILAGYLITVAAMAGVSSLVDCYLPELPDICAHNEGWGSFAIYGLIECLWTIPCRLTHVIIYLAGAVTTSFSLQPWQVSGMLSAFSDLKPKLWFGFLPIDIGPFFLRLNHCGDDDGWYLGEATCRLQPVRFASFEYICIFQSEPNFLNFTE